MSNVIAFQPPRVRARRRNRQIALGAIIPRLKDLHARGVTSIDGLTIFFHRIIGGGPETYFSVSDAGKKLMTGHLNSPGKSCFVNGQLVTVANPYIADVAIMSWKRGDWEARLFP